MSFESVNNSQEHIPEATEGGIETPDDFIEEEKGFLRKFSKGVVGKFARTCVLMSALATTNVACSNEKEETQSFNNDTNVESIDSSKIEKAIDLSAQQAIKAISTFKVKTRLGRTGFGENVINEEVLEPYLSTVKNFKELGGVNLTDKEVEKLAYSELQDALERLADKSGDEDGELDDSEREWLEKVYDSKPGLKVLSGMLESYEVEESEVEQQEVENQTEIETKNKSIPASEPANTDIF